jgi:hypothetical protein
MPAATERGIPPSSTLWACRQPIAKDIGDQAAHSNRSS